MQPEPVSLLNRLMEPVTSTAGERFRAEVVAGLIRPIQPNPPGDEYPHENPPGVRGSQGESHAGLSERTSHEIGDLGVFGWTATGRHVAPATRGGPVGMDDAMGSRSRHVLPGLHT